MEALQNESKEARQCAICSEGAAMVLQQRVDALERSLGVLPPHLGMNSASASLSVVPSVTFPIPIPPMTLPPIIPWLPESPSHHLRERSVEMERDEASTRAGLVLMESEDLVVVLHSIMVRVMRRSSLVVDRKPIRRSENFPTFLRPAVPYRVTKLADKSCKKDKEPVPDCLIGSLSTRSHRPTIDASNILSSSFGTMTRKPLSQYKSIVSKRTDRITPRSPNDHKRSDIRIPSLLPVITRRPGVVLPPPKRSPVVTRRTSFQLPHTPVHSLRPPTRILTPYHKTPPPPSSLQGLTQHVILKS